MSFSLVSIVNVEFFILPTFTFCSFLSIAIKTFIKWVEELPINYSKYRYLKVLMKINISSFSNKGD